MLHGDGAGAVVLEKADDGGPTAFVLRSDGTKGDLLRARSPVGRPPSDCDTSHNIVMNGPEVFRLAVRSMESAAREALASAGLAVEDVGCFIPHQANARIIAAVAKNLHLPPERVVETIDRYGNSGSSSIALALCEAWEDGRLHPGDNLLLAAFGGGLVWGGCVIRWTGIGPEDGVSAG